MPNDNQSQPATIQNHRKLYYIFTKLAEHVVHVIKTKGSFVKFGIKLKTMKHLRKVYDPDPKHSQPTHTHTNKQNSSTGSLMPAGP